MSLSAAALNTSCTRASAFSSEGGSFSTPVWFFRPIYGEQGERGQYRVERQRRERECGVQWRDRGEKGCGETEEREGAVQSGETEEREGVWSTVERQRRERVWRDRGERGSVERQRRERVWSTERREGMELGLHLVVQERLEHGSCRATSSVGFSVIRSHWIETENTPLPWRCVCVCVCVEGGGGRVRYGVCTHTHTHTTYCTAGTFGDQIFGDLPTKGVNVAIMAKGPHSTNDAHAFFGAIKTRLPICQI